MDTQKSRRIFLICILIGSLIANYYLCTKNYEIKEQLITAEADAKNWETRYMYSSNAFNKTEDKYSTLKNDYDSIIDEYEFYNNHACIVTEYGHRYHRYDCYHLNFDSYWIYNIEYAKYLGYTPCKDCNPPQ